MAVTTTPQLIATWAFAKSKENLPEDIVNSSDDLLQFVIRAQRGLWALAARINPGFFAESAAVAFASGGWARPVTAESIFRIENPSNVEVIRVDMDQRAADPSRPAVYRWGQKYFTAGNAADPTSGNLTFFYSKRPTTPASITSILDPLWEGAEQFNELLALETAMYIALQDGRLDEVERLRLERDYWVKLYVAFLEHEDVGVVRNYDVIKRFNTNTRVPLMSLLAGGPPIQEAA